MELIQVYVLLVICFLIYALYKELFNPSLSFFIATLALLIVKAISPADLLRGLSNQQVVIVFLLVLVTAGIRTIFGVEWFARLFSFNLKPKTFLLRMTMFVSSISAFLNNTPIVAFMIPYVKAWAERTGHAPSKFLFPLSMATILGGMITVIGTSTSLILAGLIQEYKLPMLVFTDFLYLGLIVTVTGWAYLYFFGYKLLPETTSRIEAFRQNVKEYIVETEIFSGSMLIGKTVRDAGLRNLKDVFLVEIIRSEEIISPVSPEMKLMEGDTLFFSGNKQSIYRLIKDDNGLRIPKQDKLEVEGQFNFVEAVIPAGSELVGRRIKDSDFRRRYNASIIAIHRDGKQVSGKVGEMKMSGGDFLLLLTKDETLNQSSITDLFFVSVPDKIDSKENKWIRWFGAACFLFLIAGIVGVLPLFMVCMILLMAMIAFKILDITDIRKELDLGLLLIMVSALAIGVALDKTGTAPMLAHGIIKVGNSLGPVGVISLFFIVTTLITSLVTNAAVVAVMFPIAMSIADQMHLSYTPFFVALAFSASGDFMTPIGYQTNLMIYGPGGYRFKDFVRVGVPFTVLYTVICIVFIAYYYHL
ncbi:MAG: SLC13 family permease [Bacteroidetes bacterium]|nr:SLC13 family permease [Bacteroidota bacterium]